MVGASGNTVAVDASGFADAASVGEAGVGEAGRGPRSSVADADSPKNANNMTHVMASLTLRLLFLPVANERQGFP
jgi:hypothetical protein